MPMEDVQGVQAFTFMNGVNTLNTIFFKRNIKAIWNYKIYMI